MYKHYVPDHPASVLVDLLLLHLVDPHQRAKGGCNRHAVKANLGCESAAFLAFPHWPTFEIEIGGAIKWEQRTDVSIPEGDCGKLAAGLSRFRGYLSFLTGQ